MVVEGGPSPGGGGRERARLTRPGRWPRRLLLACAALLALLAAAYGLRGPLLVRVLRAQARARLGAELAIGRVSGDFFTGLVLEDVRWRSSRPPLLRVDEGRIEARYGLGRWLRGEDWLDTASVSARGVELELGAERDQAGAPPLELPLVADVRIELDDVAVRGERAGWHLDELRARGSSDSRPVLEELELAAGANRVTLSNARIRLEGLSLAETLRRSRGAVVLSIRDPRRLPSWPERPELPLESAELALALLGERAELTGRVEIERGFVELSRGGLALAADAPLAELQLDLGLRCELGDLAPLGALLGRAVSGRWEGSIDVRGPLRAPIGRCTGRGTELLLGSLRLDSVELDLETDGARARVGRCEARGPDFEADLRGELALRPLELVDVALDVQARASALASLLPFPCEEAALHARLSGPPDRPQGAFEASATGARLGRLALDDAGARGRIERGAAVVDELRLAFPEGSARASGSVERTGTGYAVELAGLELDWKDIAYRLARPARLELGPGTLSARELELGAGAGSARVSLALGPDERRIAASFERFDASSPGALFLPPGWEVGLVDGRVEASLAGAHPVGRARLTIDRLRPGSNQPDLALELAGELTEDRLELAHLRATAGGSSALEGHASLPFDWTRPLELLEGDVQLGLDLSARGALPFALANGWSPSVEGLELQLEASGSWSRLEGSLHGAVAQLAPGDPRLERWDGEVELGFGESLRIERAHLACVHGTVDVQGELGLALDLPALRADPRSVLDAPAALEVALDFDDLADLARLSERVRRASGAVRGSFALGGTVLEPTYSGRLSWSGGELRLASQAPPLRGVSAELALDDGLVTVESFRGEIGGAPVSASGTLEPFGPFPRLDLAFRGQNLLLARSSRLRLRADADLIVKGTLDQLHVGGELRLTEARYRGEIDPLEEILRAGRGTRSASGEPRIALARTGPLALAELDVHVGGGRPFEYDTNLLEAVLRPDVRLSGTGALLTLEGPVYVESASATLPSGELELVAGVLNFRAEQPFSPEVALTAEMTVQRHEVRLAATGTLDELEIVPSSTPPLASDDLWILVLTGQPPADRWQDRSQQAMESLAVFLARDQLVRWFSDDGSDAASLLERFEIDVGAKTSASGQPTGRVVFYLKPREKRSGRATYLSAEIDEHDRVNYALGIVFRPQ